MILQCLLFFLSVSTAYSERQIDIHDVNYYYRYMNNTPVLYDAFFGNPVTRRRQEFLDQSSQSIPFNQNNPSSNATSNCLILVRTCQKDEDRRVDGTCTNPKYPSRGAGNNPFLRILPPAFGNSFDNELVPARDGSELPSSRIIRTRILADGFESDHYLTTLSIAVFVFAFVDLVDLLYLLRYIPLSTCCVGNVPNMANPQCIPIFVPPDDPYQRNTGIRCLNLTTVETFQDDGCLPRTLPPERINHATPLLDLSMIYGSDEARGRAIRMNEGGLLTFVVSGNRTTPPPTATFCINNKPELGEVACYDFGDPYDTNLLLPIYLTGLWFFREHNRLATELKKRNPCWDDEKLYQVARKINIGQWQYIFFYELMPPILGKKYMLEDGLIYNTHGYVDDFNLKYEPANYHEYVVGSRFFHNLQEGRAYLISQDGEYLGTRTVFDDSLRSGILERNNTEADLTQGYIRQPAARKDKIMDPDAVERYASNFLAVADLPAADIKRGRNQGLPGYNFYRKYCGYKFAKKFEDFEDHIDKDKVDDISKIYDDVNDVDFMTGIYLEKPLPGSYAGPVLYCITVQNLLGWRKSDRFFFEHGDYPTAFTLHQLNSIRNTSISRILCDNGDQVNKIQPHSFERIDKDNEMVPCSEIPGIDLDYWHDEKCMPTSTAKNTGSVQASANKDGPETAYKTPNYYKDVKTRVFY